MATIDDVRKALKKATIEAGSQAEMGKRLGVTGPFVSMMITGRKKIPLSVVCHLGFEKIIIFRRVR